MQLENRIFNNIEYTLVDIYDWKPEKNIYHFASDECDLFCEKIEDDYKVIENENLIKAIIDKYELKPPEVYFAILPLKVVNLLGIKQIKKLTQGQKVYLVDEQIDKLSELNCNISKDELQERLKHVTACKAEWDSAKKEMAAFYHPGTNAMYFNENNIKTNEISSKRTRLHETIHAITGPAAVLGYYFDKTGFIEGGTENIVEKLYGNKLSRFYSKNLQFNFSKNTGYIYNVALIRQMEYILKKDADESILRGDNKFFKEFSEKYGKDLFRFIKHRSNRLVAPEKLKDDESYFKETQDTILKKVFYKEFAKIKNIEDAKNYFERLQGFELVRGNFKNDNTFKKFYESRLKVAKMILSKRGYDVQVLDETCSYKESEFYPFQTKEQEYSKTQRFLINGISKEMAEDKEISSEKIKEYKFFSARKGNDYYYLLTRNGHPISLETGDPVQTTVYSEKYKRGLPSNLLQEQDSFYISNSDNEKISFEERTLTDDFDKFQSKIRENVEKKRASKQKMQEIKVIAKKQRTSIISNIISEIKNLLPRNRVLAQQKNKDTIDKEDDITK